MNNEDLATLLHIILVNIKDILSRSNSICSSSTDLDALEGDLICHIEKTIISRFKLVADAKKQHYVSRKVDEHMIEYALEELENPKDTGVFRLTADRNYDNFETELSLLPAATCPLLRFVIIQSNELSLPKYLVPLLKWHMMSVNFGNYKLKRFDIKQKPVNELINDEKDGRIRNILKNKFQDFQDAWNALIANSIVIEKIHGLEQINRSTNIEQCIVVNGHSPLKKMIDLLVQIQNSAIDSVLSLAVQHGCSCLSMLICGNGSSKVRTITLESASAADIIDYEWDEEWLNFSQREIGCIQGRKINYDFCAIEKEAARELLQGKAYICCPKAMSSIVFLDELYQKSVKLLASISNDIPQEPLTPDMIKDLKRKKDADSTQPSRLLQYLGTILSLLNKTKEESIVPISEFVDKWKLLITDSSMVKSLLPDCEFSIKLCHIVALYRWLEEVSGENIYQSDSLPAKYREPIPPDAEKTLEDLCNINLMYVELLSRALKVYVHRCLYSKDYEVGAEAQLIHYMADVSFWPSRVSIEKGIGSKQYVLKLANAEEGIILETVVPGTLLVAHVHDTITTVLQLLEVSVILIYYSPPPPKKKIYVNQGDHCVHLYEPPLFNIYNAVSLAQLQTC